MWSWTEVSPLDEKKWPILIILIDNLNFSKLAVADRFCRDLSALRQQLAPAVGHFVSSHPLLLLFLSLQHECRC